MTKFNIRPILIVLLPLSLIIFTYPVNASYKQTCEAGENVNVIELSNTDYEKERHIRPFYEPIIHPRAFARAVDYGTYIDDEVIINKDAFFLNTRDKELLIEHECGHFEDKGDEIIGRMSFSGIIRYFTTPTGVYNGEMGKNKTYQS